MFLVHVNQFSFGDHGVNNSEDAVPCGSVRRLPFINTRIPSLNVFVKFTWKSVLIERDGAPLQPVSGYSGFAVQSSWKGSHLSHGYQIDEKGFVHNS